MKFTFDEFEAVSAEIERQGGALLTEPHLSLDVKFTKPPYKRNRVDRKFSCGCGNTSRFAVEYNGESGRAALATACAVCDNMGAWPRYQHAFIDAGGKL